MEWPWTKNCECDSESLGRKERDVTCCQHKDSVSFQSINDILSVESLLIYRLDFISIIHMSLSVLADCMNLFWKIQLSKPADFWKGIVWQIMYACSPTLKNAHWWAIIWLRRTMFMYRMYEVIITYISYLIIPTESYLVCCENYIFYCKECWSPTISRAKSMIMCIDISSDCTPIPLVQCN